MFARVVTTQVVPDKLLDDAIRILRQQFAAPGQQQPTRFYLLIDRSTDKLMTIGPGE